MGTFEERTCRNCDAVANYPRGVDGTCPNCGCTVWAEKSEDAAEAERKVPRFEPEGTEYVELGKMTSANRASLSGAVREFETGATRDSNEGKIDYRAILSPQALEMFGRYMVKHTIASDGSKREQDNWKRGMPLECYIESFFRHTQELHRAIEAGNREEITEALGGCFFNLQGMMDWLADGPMLRTGSESAHYSGWAQLSKWRRKFLPKEPEDQG